MPFEIRSISGGGNGSLNFKVESGNSFPSEAEENTIMIITDSTITKWLISPEEPENPSEGMIWIKTGTSSTAEFSVLKDNNIIICPMFVKQYVSGAWVDKTAKSYKNGEWVDWWSGELYINGNEYEAFTGGMTAYAYKLSGTTAEASAPVITKDTNAITIKTGTTNSGTVYINKMFDLSKYSKMVMKITECTGHEIRVGFTETKATDFTLVAYKLVPTGSYIGTYSGTIELDLSSETTTCYPVITMMNTATKAITFTEWKLVP